MEKFIYQKPKDLSSLPQTPGVYGFFNKKGEILYIGKSSNIKERVKNHFKNPTFKDTLFLNEVFKIGFIKTDSEIESLLLEARLIKKYQPKFNVMWRDDKNYFFVGITKEEFPRIFITHQPLTSKSSSLEIQTLNSIYIGPFVDGKSLKKTLHILRKIFPFRTCKKIPKKPCLWYQLERCQGVCKALKTLSEKEIKDFKKDYQKEIKKIITILKEGRERILKMLKKEMENFSKKQQFEKAAKIRDQIFALEKIFTNARILSSSFSSQQSNILLLEKLKKILKIKKLSRIEAYDISNIQGKQATGSMVTFVNGKPEKSFYRRFKIKTISSPNDVGMLREVLKRRFSHKEWPYPEVLLIDGGKAQLNVALNLKKENTIPKNIKIISLAKKENKLFIEGQKEPLFLKNLPREIFNLILQLRDEAHRFAKKYHQKIRAKQLLKR